MLKTTRLWMGRGTKTTHSLGASRSLNPALHEIKCNGMMSFMEFMHDNCYVSRLLWPSSSALQNTFIHSVGLNTRTFSLVAEALVNGLQKWQQVLQKISMLSSRWMPATRPKQHFYVSNFDCWPVLWETLDP